MLILTASAVYLYLEQGNLQYCKRQGRNRTLTLNKLSIHGRAEPIHLLHLRQSNSSAAFKSSQYTCCIYLPEEQTCHLVCVSHLLTAFLERGKKLQCLKYISMRKIEGRRWTFVLILSHHLKVVKDEVQNPFYSINSLKFLPTHYICSKSGGHSLNDRWSNTFTTICYITGTRFNVVLFVQLKSSTSYTT